MKAKIDNWDYIKNYTAKSWGGGCEEILISTKIWLE